MPRQSKSAASQQQDKALAARLEKMRKSALALGKTDGLAFIRETASHVFDQMYQPVEVLDIEVESARQALDELRDKLKVEEAKLADMDEYLATPPDEEKADEK